MIVEKKASSSNHGVLAGRTARACDNCLSDKASWFCVSDDAFLCHGCDALVHSANQLARRHERIRLQAASSMAVQTSMATIQSSQPSSVHGFSRRTTTPKEKKKISTEKQGKEREIAEISYPVVPLVPEMGSDETLGDENEDHLLQRVPVFDFCSILNEADEDEQKFFVSEEFDDFSASFLPSELDLADFVADVESLLEEDTGDFHFRNQIRNVKKEEEEEEEEKETRNNDHIQTDLDFRINREDEVPEEKLLLTADQTVVKDGNEETQMETKIFLRLNYEEIISAWDGDCSLWNTGCRLELSLHDCSPDYYLGLRPGEEDGRVCRKAGGFSGGGGGRDAEREARVSRYREKRRSRLFEKKIRYQVRKLNAEKRPRMKGRFVKRTT